MERLEPKSRRAGILNAAVTVANKHGFYRFTRADVALEAGVSDGLINRYYGSMENLRQNVMLRAISTPVLSVLAQGLAARCPVALSAPPELRAEAAKTII